MSRWQEVFDSHAIHETLKQLKALASKEFQDIDEDEVPERRRFIKAISAYEDVLSRLDAELVPMNQLDGLNNALRHQNIWEQVSTYADNGDATLLVAANDQLSNQLTQLSLLLAIARLPTAEKSIKNLEGAVDYIGNALAEKKVALEGSFDGLSESVTKSQQELKRLEDMIEKRRVESDSQLSQWQQQFSEAQERRNNEFTAWRGGLEETFNELLNETSETLKKHQDVFAGKVGEILSDGREKHRAILELYELTASDSVGAGHLKNALDERSQANLWRWISIGFILVTAAWLFYAYYHSAMVGVESGIVWSRVFTVFSLTGVLLFGAAFSSQQSNRHRASEKRASWFALQVKAIDPFIESLDSKERNDLKRLFSERLFANPEELRDGSGTVISEHAVNVVVKSITDILGKMPKV